MVKIINGDLFDSKANIIAHQVNCQGVMGSGVALQVKQKYPNVYEGYKRICNGKMLGKIQLIPINSHKQMICNIFGQDSCGYDGRQYTSIEALSQCFRELAYFATKNKYTIAMPYGIGCVRGGADWNKVYQMIEDIFVDGIVELWKWDRG